MSAATKLIKGATGDWEMVIGLEVHAQVTSTQSYFLALRRNLAASRIVMSRWSTRRCQACCLSSTSNACARRCAPVSASTHGSTCARCSTARTISIPIAARLSNQPVQIADRRRRRSDCRIGRWHERRGRNRAAASGTGCRQITARSQPDDVVCGPQPVRRRLDGNCIEARYPLFGAGQGICLEAALDPSLSRHLRR